MIEAEIRTLILAEPTLSTVAAVHPLNLPQGASKPAITYAFHDGQADLTHGGVMNLKRFTCTFKVFAETYSEARTVTRALTDFLNGMSQPAGADTVVSAKVHNVFSDYEDGLELYTNIIDLTLYAREA